MVYTLLAYIFIGRMNIYTYWIINTFIRMYQNTLWAISALSDVQELIDRGFLGEACDKINDAKGIIKGQFEVIEDGFAIAR